jgi:AcrR family transcriptional regulator
MTAVNKKLDPGHFFLHIRIMAKALQKRTLETRARLIAAAEDVINQGSFEALRVEEVVLRAGTAKGTFFAHFKDKDALMELIIGARLDAHIDELEAATDPVDVEILSEALMPLCAFMTSERYVFDLILRYSGAAAVETIGPIAMNFGRQVALFERWVTATNYRNDVPTDLQAEGIQAFMIQAMATHFCALHNAQSVRDRLAAYLNAWLVVPVN